LCLGLLHPLPVAMFGEGWWKSGTLQIFTAAGNLYVLHSACLDRREIPQPQHPRTVTVDNPSYKDETNTKY
jgi:hypothetical protein